ncbi:MAG: hypothetical protein IKV15_08400 [Bacteroidaceae bacterium]|nr:hypothetical protein [Bacteroidaceae bacterium]
MWPPPCLALYLAWQYRARILFSKQEYTTLLADTSYTIGRSLAAGDINFALLVK